MRFWYKIQKMVTLLKSFNSVAIANHNQTDA